jgi:hypothetical protein
MNINSAFPSNYLKAADLGGNGRRVTVTIESVEMEDIGDTDKPVVYFKDKKKGLVLNKTNSNMIAEIANSEETDNWTGVQVTLYSTKTDFQGRRVDAIRVEPPVKNNSSRAMQEQVPPPSDNDRPPDDDTVPF